MTIEKEENWDLIVKPQVSLLSLNLKEVWQYRDLLVLMVKRDIVTVYKQTILGPVWFFLQPMLTTFIFTLVFSNIAKLPTDGIPPVLFYLSGLILWNYFSETLLSTSKTFVENAPIFGKVYFPRLIMPLAKTISGLIKFLIQLLLFISVLVFYQLQGASVVWSINLLWTPFLLVLMSGLGLGFGVLLSSLTTKYRDLIFLINFGVQLMMYATPVIIPFSTVPLKYQWIMWFNPMTSVIETFRYAFIGGNYIDLNGLMYSVCFMLVLLMLGIVTFNRVEKSFIDTV